MCPTSCYEGLQEHVSPASRCETTCRHPYLKQGSEVTCSLARSSCSTKSSRSWAAKCLMPISSSPSLCLAIVILNSCGFHYQKKAKEERKNMNEYIPPDLKVLFLERNFWKNSCKNYLKVQDKLPANIMKFEGKGTFVITCAW